MFKRLHEWFVNSRDEYRLTREFFSSESSDVFENELVSVGRKLLWEKRLPSEEAAIRRTERSRRRHVKTDDHDNYLLEVRLPDKTWSKIRLH